jgi:hypothetical protein
VVAEGEEMHRETRAGVRLGEVVGVRADKRAGKCRHLAIRKNRVCTHMVVPEEHDMPLCRQKMVLPLQCPISMFLQKWRILSDSYALLPVLPASQQIYAVHQHYARELQ